VPSKDKCLAAKDQNKPSDPYWTKLETCAQSWAQRWVLHPTHSNDIFWVRLSPDLLLPYHGRILRLLLITASFGIF